MVNNLYLDTNASVGIDFKGMHISKGESKGQRSLSGRLFACLFISGKTPEAIAKLFTERGVSTPGGQARWRAIIDPQLRDLVLDRCRCLCKSFMETSALGDEIEDHLRECGIIAELSRRLKG